MEYFKTKFSYKKMLK